VCSPKDDPSCLRQWNATILATKGGRQQHGVKHTELYDHECRARVKSPITGRLAHCRKSFQSHSPRSKYCPEHESAKFNEYRRRHRKECAARHKAWTESHPGWREKFYLKRRKQYAADPQPFRDAANASYAKHGKKWNRRKKAARAAWTPEQRAADNQRQRKKYRALVEAKRKLGRPRTREDDIAKYGPRIKELRTQRKSWGQIQSIMNRETAQNRSVSGWRHLIKDRVTTATA
jgi:hypothetical protein